MSTRQAPRLTARKSASADRVAFVAVAGVAVCLAVWVLLACVDLALGQADSLAGALFHPTGTQTLARLGAVALVLVATLIVQMLTRQRARLEQRLMVEHDKLLQTYEHSNEPILCLDPDMTITYANTAASNYFAANRNVSTLVGMHCADAVWGEGHREQCLGMEVLRRGETTQRTVHDTADGADRWFEETVFAAFNEDGEVEQLIEVFRDVTEHVSAQRTISHMAYHDPLTDLPNRMMFNDRLINALAQAKRRGETVAVGYVDIDDFKGINESLGHETGDAVLKEVATRLVDTMREEDTVARQSADEFTFIARMASREDASILAQRILTALGSDFEVGGRTVSLSASIGIATYPDDGVEQAQLLRCADAALYRAKELGHGSYRLYVPEMSRSATDRLKLETALRRAIDKGEFELFYQPQIDSRYGSPIGVEALIRWNHPEEGLLAPAAFIEFAEKAGFMSQIGPWVMRTACVQASAWQDAGLKFGRMAVNLSAKEFEQYDMVEMVERILNETGLEPSHLELEITETVAMKSPESMIETLQCLRDLGVRVAIDDFGTGYSSMSYIKKLPVQTLKIAQTFMRDVHLDAQNAAITTMLIGLCQELELDIVAEGVEHPSELEFLRKQGCFVIQGYIYSPPLPAGEASALLVARVRPKVAEA